MKKLILILIIICSSCQNKEDRLFDNFIFSAAGLHYDYSVKFASSDTVFFQKRFPDPKQNYFALINKKDKQELKQFIKKLDFTKYDTIYSQENLQDGGSLLFSIDRANKNHWVFIYGHKAPDELYKFASWLRNFKDKQKLTATSENIHFGDLKYLIPPPPPPKVTKVMFK